MNGYLHWRCECGAHGYRNMHGAEKGVVFDRHRRQGHSVEVWWSLTLQQRGPYPTAANLDGAQLDYEALIGEVGLRLLRRVNRGETLTPERVTTEMLNVFDAALPDKETPNG